MTKNYEKYKYAKDSFWKFRDKSFRDHQEEIIDFACSSKKKFVVIEAPTGIGKTLCGMVIGRVLGNALYTVHSRPLQTQTSIDFPGIPIMWGRRNYECALDPRISADNCPVSKNCREVANCEYIQSKKTAVASNLSILNYHYLLHELNYVGQFAKRDVIVIDEADSLENVLADFVGIKMSQRMVSRLGIGTPKYKTAASDRCINSWKDWAAALSDKMKREVVHLEQRLHTIDKENVTDADIKILNDINTLYGYISKLYEFKELVDDTWIFEEQKTKYGTSYVFNPTWINEKIADKYLWGHCKKFVLMSATFPYVPVLCKLLGLRSNEVEYRQYPSIFPVKNRIVKYKVAADLVYKKMDHEIPKAIQQVKDILKLHPNEKGLIHTVSYKLADAVMGINDKRLITHKNDVERLNAIALLKKTDKPLVLVSPSLERGVSLDDDFCRFIIWLKAPFMPLNDKLVQARLYGSGGIGNIWYKSMMLLSIVQGCGRGVRSETDSCVTYIIDKQIQKAISDNPAMVPLWFREAVW